MKQWYVALFAIPHLCSCSADKNQTAGGTPTAASCKGVYTERDSQGNLQKYNQFWQNDQKTCLTEKIALTNYESSTELRRKQNVSCVPQPTFPSMALKSSGNFYSYRDGRYYLDFDSTTGIFRRLTLGEDANGNVVFQRDLSCFYAREDHETEPVDPQDYGKQLMLDFSNYPASSADFVPVEIFKYSNDSAGNWFFTRYDDVSDWDFTFCPELTVPFEFCTAMRNGNIYYYPVLDAATQGALATQAKLIRTQFNFSQITRSDFESIWQDLDKNGKELQQGGDWKYYTNHIVDASKFFDYDWRQYLMGKRSTMPDVSLPMLPPVCWDGYENVVLSNGNTGRIYGQICLANGQYSFTQL